MAFFGESEKNLPCLIMVICGGGGGVTENRRY